MKAMSAEHEALVVQLAKAVPFAASLNIRITRMQAGVVHAEMAVLEQHLRPGGSVSGPVMMTMADMLAYACILNAQISAVQAVTVSQNNQFLSRPTLNPLKARGNLVRMGKRLAFINIVLYQSSIKHPVCMVTSVYAMPPDAPSMRA